MTFGAELARETRIRFLNFGSVERPGATIKVSGLEVAAPRFATCRHCGIVKGARPTAPGRDTRHLGWCKTRSAVKEQWEELALVHELTTDAIRMLVPVAVVEAQERLATFQAILRLGLRVSFGGDPDHLRVVTADMPARAGHSAGVPAGHSAGHTGVPAGATTTLEGVRRRFVVLYDTIPGGTGYLDRLADPDRLRDILLGARALIAACPCKDEGLLACHRCLLGVTDRPSVSLVTRPLALEQLDELLSDWATEPVATVADLQIDELEESELERMFRAALVAWDAKRDDVLITAAPGGRHYGFEVRITTTLPNGGAEAPAREEVVRWRIREQQDVVAGGVACRPDFLFTRLDGNPQEIAVFVDGQQFHASPEHDRLADDANKRNALRLSGRLVWSLTWADIQAFLNAQTSDVDRTVRPSGLLSTEVVQLTQHLQQSFSGSLTGAVAGMNAMEQLVRFLREPVPGDWEQLACSAVAAVAKDNVVLVDDLGLVDTLRGFLDGHLVTTPLVAPTSATGAVGVVGGLAVILDLRSGKGPNEQRWTALALTPDGVQLGPPGAPRRALPLRHQCERAAFDDTQAQLPHDRRDPALVAAAHR